MTDEMTIAEYHEYQRTGKMPKRYDAPTRSSVIATVAETDPGLATVAAERPTRESKSVGELHEYLMYGGFGRVETEYQFHLTRKWRADFALIDQNPIVLIEYDGLMNKDAYGNNVGHASINGIIRDADKANAAIALGFRYFRANAKTVQSGDFYALLETVLEVLS